MPEDIMIGKTMLLIKYGRLTLPPPLASKLSIAGPPQKCRKALIDRSVGVQKPTNNHPYTTNIMAAIGKKYGGE
jgi:hypothetical protein